MQNIVAQRRTLELKGCSGGSRLLDQGLKFKKFRPKLPIWCNFTVDLLFTCNDWNQYKKWNLWK